MVEQAVGTIGIVWDIHAQSTNPKKRKDNYFLACMQKLEYILQHEKTVIMLGDIFHRAVVQDEVKNRMLALFAKYNSKIYVVPGNHDIQNDLMSTITKTSLGNLAYHNAVTILECGKVYEIEGLRVGVLPYDLKAAKAQAFDSVDIVVGHHFYNWTLKSPEHSLQDEDIAKYNARYLFLGHDHRPYPDVFTTSGCKVLRWGSLMRTALYEWTVDHKPKYCRLLTDSMMLLPCNVPAIPAQEAFKLTEHKELKKNVKLVAEIRTYLETLNVNKPVRTSMREQLQLLQAPEKVVDFLESVHRYNSLEF